MSGHHNDQDLLTRTLRDRSDDMAGSHLGLDQVKGRARGIRRRRRTVGGVAAAVVLAIGVPVGLDADQLTRGRQQPLPANPSPSVVETATPDPSPTPGVPVLADGAAAPRGQDPLIPYLDGSTLHETGHDPVDLERSYDSFTAVAEGWMAVSEETGRTYAIDSEGNVLDDFPGAGLAVSSNGAWLVTQLEATGGTDLQLRPRSGTEIPLSATVSNGGTVELIGLTGEQQAAYTETVDGSQGATSRVFVTDFERDPRQLEGLIGARGTTDRTGMVAGQTSFSDTGSCWAMVEAGTGQRLWKTCAFALGPFSPDGHHVMGTDAYADGIGGSTVAILDAATGDVVAEFTTRDIGHTGQALWESDSSLLVSTYQDGAWYLLRLRPDGSMEQALDPVHTRDDVSSPWRFAIRP